jgi:glutathione synthase/RimK-type ligase-like ATP-grasp enzyme
MITAIGLGTDPTVRHFCEAAARLGHPVELVDLRQLVTTRWQVSLPGEHASWVELVDGVCRPLDRAGTYYCRIIDLGGVSPGLTVAWRTLVTALGSWLELNGAIVVNRPGHVNDNACKPLHEAKLAEAGLRVPASYTGSDRAALVSFAAEGRTVAKALCGQRADCRLVSVDDFRDYDERSGPVHLQRFVPGDDVRAHVVGEEVISVRVRSLGTDYRMDAEAKFERCSLPTGVADVLRQATARFGLAFAGWDLRLAGDECWVLEANPMPGYGYYDTKVDLAITRALLRHLNQVRPEGHR